METVCRPLTEAAGPQETRLLAAIHDNLRPLLTRYEVRIEAETLSEVQRVFDKCSYADRTTTAVAMIVALCVVGAAAYLAKYLLQPFNEFLEAARDVAGGNRKRRLPTGRNDEFSAISRAFNEMLDALNATTVSRDELDKLVRQRTAELDRFFSLAGDAMSIGDFHGRLLRVNPAFSKVFGYTESELLSIPARDHVHPDDLPTLESALGRLAAGVVKTAEFEIRGRARDGSWRVLSWKAVAAPELGLIYGTARDVTDLRRTTQELLEARETLEIKVRKRTAALAESDRRHSTLLSNLPGMAYRACHDRRRTMIFASDGCRDVLGIEPVALVQAEASYEQLIHPEDRQRVWDEIQSGVAKSGTFKLEYRVIHSGGGVRWVWEQGRLDVGSNRTGDALEGFIADITDRKEAEAALIRQEQRLSSFFKALPSGVGIVRDGMLLEGNERLCEMTGYGLDELLSVSTRILFASTEDYEFVGRELYGKMRQNGGGSVETRWRRKDGKAFDVLISSSILDAAGAMTFTFAATDISDRKQREREVERMNRLYAALSQVNQAVVRARSREEVFDKVCRAALSYGGLRSAWVGWRDPGTQAVKPIACFGELAEKVSEMRIFAHDRIESSGPTGIAIREGRTVVHNALTTDPAMSYWKTQAEESGVGSAASFPIRVGGIVRGALVLYAGEANFFQEREVLLLEEAASDVSFALNVLESEAQRCEAEEASRQRQARLDSLFRALPSGVGVAHNRVLTEVNSRLCALSGYTPEELMGKSTEILYASAAEFEKAGRELYGVRRDNPVGSAESRWKRKNGENYDVLICSSALDPADPMAITFTVADITEINLAKAEIRTLSQAIEQSPVSIIITDLQGRIEYVNDRFTEVTGYRADEVRGMNPRILKSGKTPPEDFAALWRTLKAGGQWRGQFQNKKKNGELFWELASISPIRDSRGVLTHFLAVKEDITDRRNALERIRYQAALLDQTRDAVVVFGADHRIKYANASAGRMYGTSSESLLGEAAEPLLFPQQPGMFASVCRTTREKGEWSGELKPPGAPVRTFQSNWTAVEIAGEAGDYLVVNTDVTEKRRLEEQFLRAQRMESIGTIAGGVAHDLNNILAPILIAVNLLSPLMRSREDESLVKMLRDGVQRGAGLVRQLLLFGRGLEGQRSEFQPRVLLKEMAKVITETFPKSITLELQIASDLWNIEADITQFHQILLNLCVNARDAMPHGGTLTLSAESVLLDEDYAHKNPEAKAGPHIVVRVADTGMGIAPEIFEKIFDPFFTTKSPGKGTGLGLSTVLGIVKNHGGFIQVSSSLGQGTKFNVYLPAVGKSREPVDAHAVAAPPQGHGELILLVDDEESIRGTLERVLERNGYSVVTAGNGAEALVLCSQRKRDLKAVVTDMAMPTMDGASLIRVLHGYVPGVPVIAMSGMADLESIASKTAPNFAGFIHKPFTAEALLTTLNTVVTRG